MLIKKWRTKPVVRLKTLQTKNLDKKDNFKIKNVEKKDNKDKFKTWPVEKKGNGLKCWKISTFILCARILMIKLVIIRASWEILSLLALCLMVMSITLRKSKTSVIYSNNKTKNTLLIFLLSSQNSILLIKPFPNCI